MAAATRATMAGTSTCRQAPGPALARKSSPALTGCCPCRQAWLHGRQQGAPAWRRRAARTGCLTSRSTPAGQRGGGRRVRNGWWEVNVSEVLEPEQNQSPARRAWSPDLDRQAGLNKGAVPCSLEPSTSAFKHTWSLIQERSTCQAGGRLAHSTGKPVRFVMDCKRGRGGCAGRSSGQAQTACRE